MRTGLSNSQINQKAIEVFCEEFMKTMEVIAKRTFNDSIKKYDKKINDLSDVQVVGNIILDGVIETINGLSPDAAGNVTLTMKDIPNLEQTIDQKLDVNLEGATEGELALTNADMLGNVPANEYALKTDIGSAAVSTGIQMELLWENPDATVEFAAQTISMDLSNYTYILVKTLFLTNEAYANLKKFSMFEKGETSVLSHLNEVYSGDVNIYNGIREVTINDDSIVFTDCNYRKINTSDATTTTVENKACIPLKIYGIKGV